MAKTEAQKKKRREKRALKKQAAKAHGKAILMRAEADGYKPQGKHFSGKGDYKAARPKKARGRGDIFEDAGGWLGRQLGGLGRKAYNSITGTLKNFLGDGDYVASGFPQQGYINQTSMPVMEGNGGGNGGHYTQVEHHQMICELKACEDFTVTEYHINPGLPDFLNWLAPQANQYEQYELVAMMFKYVPTVTPYSAAASGDLGFVVDYDTDAIAASSIANAANQYLAVFGKPADQILEAVEAKPSETSVRIKKTRAAEESTDAKDDQWYDHGILRIYQQGQPSATVGQTIGRLYCCYNFKFYKPKTDAFPLQTPTAHYKTEANLATTTPLGTSAADWVAGGGNSLPLVWTSPTSFAMPSYVDGGKWMIVTHAIASSGAMTCPTYTVSGGAGVSLLATSAGYGVTSGCRGPQAAVTATEGVSLMTVDVNAASPEFTVASISMTTPTQFEIFVLPLDVDLVSLRAKRESHARYEARFALRKQQETQARLRWEQKENSQIEALQKQIDILARKGGQYADALSLSYATRRAMLPKGATMSLPNDDFEDLGEEKEEKQSEFPWTRARVLTEYGDRLQRLVGALVLNPACKGVYPGEIYEECIKCLRAVPDLTDSELIKMLPWQVVAWTGNSLRTGFVPPTVEEVMKRVDGDSIGIDNSDPQWLDRLRRNAQLVSEENKQQEKQLVTEAAPERPNERSRSQSQPPGAR